MNQAYRLLRSQCVYCHGLRMSRVEVDRYWCKLRLLQYGLLKEAEDVDDIGLRSREFKAQVDAAGDAEEDLSEDENANTAHTIMDQRRAFVKRCIAQIGTKPDVDDSPTEAISQTRAAIVRDFQADIVKTRKCANCKGYVREQLVAK